jgi:hypothetical protein
MAYDILIPEEISEAVARLPYEDGLALRLRLAMVAEVSEDVSPSPRVRPLWLELAGVMPGEHRVLVGEHWLLYRVNDEEHSVRVLALGDVAYAPRAGRTEPWHASARRADAWDNEGGGNLPTGH